MTTDKTTDFAPSQSNTNIIVPLVFDLDGSLINTDSLVESILYNTTKHPLSLLKSLPYLLKGKAIFKQEIGKLDHPDPSLWPYNFELIEWAKREKKAGREIYLATAADQVIADGVAKHLDLFSGVFASNGSCNLSGSAKGKALVAEFGEHGFDYVGNSRTDLAVWSKARYAYCVPSTPNLTEIASKQDIDLIKVGGAKKSPFRAFFHELRPHQWLKNTLVFLPMIAAHLYLFELLLLGIASFVIFSIVASAGYITNDLLDIESDRLHPSKRLRPLAAGTMPIIWAFFATPLMIVAGLLSALSISVNFFLITLFYLITTICYSFILKKILMIDVITLSSLYIVRVVAGAIGTGIYISHWLLLFSMFLFSSLAFVKRTVELVNNKNAGKPDVPGRGYVVDDLPIVQSLSISSGFGSIIVFCLYLNSEAANSLYNSAWMIWAIVPLLILWVSRLYLLANRGALNEDPLIFAVTDRLSLLIGFICMFILIGAKVI